MGTESERGDENRLEEGLPGKEPLPGENREAPTPGESPPEPPKGEKGKARPGKEATPGIPEGPNPPPPEDDWFIPQRPMVINLFGGGLSSTEGLSGEWSVGEQPTPLLKVRLVSEDELEENPDDWRLLEETIGIKLLDEEDELSSFPIPSSPEEGREEKGIVTVERVSIAPMEGGLDEGTVLGPPHEAVHLALSSLLQRFAEISEKVEKEEEAQEREKARRERYRVPLYKVIAWGVLFTLCLLVATELFFPNVGHALGLSFLDPWFKAISEKVLELFQGGRNVAGGGVLTSSCAFMVFFA